MHHITFKEFLAEESGSKLPWNGSPAIGWWRDGSKLRVYHGTDLQHYDSIAKTGLDRLDPKTGMISFALEPFTARAFSVMGGEARFLGAGAHAKTVPENKRITLVFDLPRAFVDAHEDPDLRGNDPEHKKRLQDEDEYRKFKGGDQQYYQLCELRVNAKVPAKYLVGYMVK
jgi:hypothetical protein